MKKPIPRNIFVRVSEKTLEDIGDIQAKLKVKSTRKAVVETAVKDLKKKVSK